MKHRCFYCEEEGKYVIDDKDGLWFLCGKHYKIFLAKYGQKTRRKKEEE
jgi:hypothetical protein